MNKEYTKNVFEELEYMELTHEYTEVYFNKNQRQKWNLAYFGKKYVYRSYFNIEGIYKNKELVWINMN